MKKKILSLFSITALLGFGSTIVLAGTVYEGYNTSVGPFNGSGYTGYQTKIHSGANGKLLSNSVGANYVVDARMIDSSGNAGSWTRNVNDNAIYTLAGNSSQTSGKKVRVQFSNDLLTPVSVQVTGSWRSD